MPIIAYELCYHVIFRRKKGWMSLIFDIIAARNYELELTGLPKNI